MVHDDDSGRRGHNKLDWTDDPDDYEPSSSPPSRTVEDQIVQLARRPGWGVERIHAWFRAQNRNDVSYATIQRVIARARASRRL
jgi:hypothetical protein